MVLERRGIKHSNMLLNCWQFMGYPDVAAWGDPLLMPGGTGPLPGLT